MTSDFDDSGPRFYPGLDDVFLHSTMLGDVDVLLLEAREFRCLMQLVRFCASARAWTYTAPDPDGWLRGGDAGHARIAGVSRKMWLSKIKPALLPFLEVEDDRIRVARDWFFVRPEGASRPAARRSQPIHPRIFSDPAFVSVSVPARVLLLGLGTLCDEAKRFPWNEDLIASALALASAATELAELEAASLIAREGRRGLILFDYGLRGSADDEGDAP